METTQRSERRERAAAELDGRCRDLSSHEIVDNLSVGLTHLRDLLVVRAHDDVEQKCGRDSINITSLTTMQRQARITSIEIEAYVCIVVDDEVARSGYVNNHGTWFLEWIFRLRLGERSHSLLEQRVEYYRSQTAEERRLKFVSMLQRCMPESARAPLVLFRLFPRAVRIATAVAFSDPLRAQELRAEQASFLPAIGDCHECFGHVLDNEEVCRCCGNPIWNFGWLLSD